MMEEGEPMHVKKLTQFILCGAVLGVLSSPVFGTAEDGYPADYKPSKPAATGETNVLNRLAPIATYMNDKLTAAGGNNSAMCYRNCLTVAYNDILKCIEAKVTYTASESCEKDASNKMATCDSKCQ